MECQVCHKNFKALTNTHLTKHGFTPKEYEDKFRCKTVPNGWGKGENNAFFGKRHEEGKSKLKTREYSMNLSNKRRGRTYEELYGEEVAARVKEIRRKRFIGKNNPNWINGDNIFYPKEFHITRPIILKRDNYRCAICNSKYNPHVHHIDYNKNNSDDLNLISMCPSCHIPTNFGNRKYWTFLLTDIIHRRYGNQQPSLESNFFEGSETNVQLLTGNAVESNNNTSALHPNGMMI